MVRKASYPVHEACGEHHLEKDEAGGLGMKSVAGTKMSRYFAKWCQ